MENFHVTMKLQWNKDTKNPRLPGSLLYPQVEALIVIAEELDPSCDGGECHGHKNALTFNLYQPQIINILRTIETIGFFNEFKQCALFDFKHRKLTS